jgi:hypothetical protein
VRAPDAPATAGIRLVVAGIAMLPASVALTAAFPTAARPAVFIIGLGAVAGLCIAGGIQARGALLSGVIHTGRTVVVGIVGLTMGGVAAIAFVTAVAGILL